jgi:hypothetical protein
MPLAEITLYCTYGILCMDVLATVFFFYVFGRQKDAAPPESSLENALQSSIESALDDLTANLTRLRRPGLGGVSAAAAAVATSQNKYWHILTG